ncbi:MAG TPA: Mur ligase family protein, partial [Armatimonadota bacterium]|nr:Mur ligase family protein [Armatimonadota bacterium]
SDYLQALRIPCRSPYSAENLPPDADLIVIGKHAKLVPESNPEVRAAFGKPVRSFPEVLQELTADTRNLVVAGSYGKSTCSALAAWALLRSGRDPSYFVGAITYDLPANSHLGSGSAFVLEGDEYPSANWDDRSKFLYYNPRSVLLISGTHDHVNVFPTVEEYLKPYRELVRLIPPEGLLVACLDGEHVPELLPLARAGVVTYSLDKPEADWRAADITRGTRTDFRLLRRGEEVTRISSVLLGDHNVQNMVGAGALLLETGLLTPEELATAFREFRGVKRRLELKTPNARLPVYEDFGSSYAKAEAGIRSMRAQFPDRRLLVVFEPHTFSFRNRSALGWYDTLFREAARVFVYDPPSHGAATHDQLSQEEIVAAIRRSGTPAQPFHTWEQLRDTLGPELKDEDVVLMVTSGAMGGSIQALADHVTAHFPA